MSFNLLTFVATSLSRKLGLCMLAGALIATPLTHLGLAAIVQSSFAQLEADYVDQQVERVQHGVTGFSEEVLRATRDYAVWDDSYVYMESPTKAFEDETLSPLAQKNLDVDFFGYIRFGGEIVRGEAVDLERMVPLAGETVNLRRIVTDPVFLKHAVKRETFVTFVETPRGVYAVATGWVRRSNGGGTPSGFVVMARRMGSADLSEVLRVPVNIRRLPAPGAVAATASSEYRDQVVHSVQPLIGPGDRPVGTVEFDTRRTITELGKSTIMLASAIVFGLILVSLAILGFVVRRVVIKPLISLSVHMREAESMQRYRASSLGQARDEIGFLARTFDGTLEALGAAREKLREQSYLQGQSDSAAGTLHNLRNALGPVRVLQQKWAAEEQAPWRRHLARALREIDGGAEGGRRDELVHYVLAVARQITAQNEGRVTEMAESEAALDQVVAILLTQQEKANQKLLLEPIDLQELVTAAASIARHHGRSPLEVHLPNTMPWILANHLQLSQLLGNIFKNAAESIEAAGQASGQIVVTIGEGSPSHIELVIRDNGEGFTPEQACRLFEKGYSTRREKFGGIGLHWCANSASAMGGSLRLTSDGTGKGAAVFLDLQRYEAEVRQAA